MSCKICDCGGKALAGRDVEYARRPRTWAFPDNTFPTLGADSPPDVGGDVLKIAVGSIIAWVVIGGVLAVASLSDRSRS